MRFALVLATAVSLLGGGAAADAHAFLDHANPRVGNTVRTAPREVTLWFTQNLEPAFSTISVTDASGHRMDTGGVKVSGSVMRIGVRPLRPGTYRVRWRVLSVDTHTTEGNFSFQVGD